MDYIALGHFHTPQSVIRDVAASQRSYLSQLKANDLGAHGYIEEELKMEK